MTRNEIIAALSAIERALDTRITIVRIIIDESAHEIGRLYRGRFVAPLCWSIGARNIQED